MVMMIIMIKIIMIIIIKGTVTLMIIMIMKMIMIITIIPEMIIMIILQQHMMTPGHYGFKLLCLGQSCVRCDWTNCTMMLTYVSAC